MYDDTAVANGPKKVENRPTASMTGKWVTKLWSEWWLQRLYGLGKVLYERCEEEIPENIGEKALHLNHYGHKRVTGLPNGPFGG